MTSFEFQVIDPQIAVLRIKETDIREDRKDKNTGEAKESGREFQVKMEIVGGHQNGIGHTEFFYENTKNDFSLFKLAGLLMKAGIMPVKDEVDTDTFKTDSFRKKFKTGISGKMLGGKFRMGKDFNGNPRAELEKYLSADEAKALQSKGGTTPAPAGAPAAEPAKDDGAWL